MIINKNAPALLQGYLNYALTIKALSPKTVQCYERDIMLFFKYLIMATHEYRMLENVTDVCFSISSRISSSDAASIFKRAVEIIIFTL